MRPPSNAPAVLVGSLIEPVGHGCLLQMLAWHHFRRVSDREAEELGACLQGTPLVDHSDNRYVDLVCTGSLLSVGKCLQLDRQDSKQ